MKPGNIRRIGATLDTFGEIARVYNGRMQEAGVAFTQPTEWPKFVEKTVAYARTQIVAYEHIEESTRAQWKLENAKEFQDYDHWCRIVADYSDYHNKYSG